MPATPRHPAAVVEDAVNRVRVAVQRRLGWRPHVIGYVGYGLAPTRTSDGQGWVRVLGRVVMARRPISGSGRDGPRQEPIRGWRSFIASHLSGTGVTVSVAGAEVAVTADRSGVIDAVVPVDLAPGAHPVGFVPAGGARSTGTVLVSGAATVGLVSDIDDTVVVTWLPRPFIAAWNTFVLRETARTVVSGMAELYQEFVEAHPGAPVVYLSTGAWNAAPALGRFLHRHDFPEGPLLLTDWGPTNTGWFRSGQLHKRAALHRLADEMPWVRWVLIGDDGQHDPQIYDDFADSHPEHVRAIAIRHLSPAEQVLARGSVVGVPDEAAPDSPVVRVRAPDGHELAARLRDRGVL